MRSAIRKLGNSSGVILPKAILDQLKMRVGDAVEMTVKDGKLTIAGTRRHPREGWEEEARKIVEAGEDVAVWPEFANEGDDELTW